MTSGKTETLEQIHGISGGCHKRFRTQAQAEAFIEDWKESFAEVWRREIKQALDRGLRPQDMSMSMKDVLYETGNKDAVEDLTGEVSDRLELGA